MNEACLAWLATAARDCDLILELGTYRGRSACAMLDNSEARLWCVDNFCGPAGAVVTEADYDICRDNLKPHLNRVRFLVEDTVVACGLLGKYAKPFDMVFIDASHDYESVKADIKAALPLVRAGGLLCGHDYSRSWPGVRQAVDELLPSRRVEGVIWYVNLE